jgi:predicted phosphodiesterase
VTLALISDIHGNRVALERVVADGLAHGADEWWVLGDLAAIGVDPVATLEMVANLPNARFVRGNTDRYIVTGERPYPHADDVERDPSLQSLFDVVEASFAWTRDALTTEWLAWLGDLPLAQRTVLTDGTSLLGVHASVASDDGAGITPDVDDHTLRRLVRRAGADIVCGGHTHRITDRRVDGMRAVNLGSVSNPVTTDLRASYVLVAHDRHGHRLAHRRVAYDHDAVVHAIRRSTHPDVDYLTGFQLGAQARYPALDT